MAVVTLKSTAVTNADASTMTANKLGIDGGKEKRRVGLATITNGDSSTSTYRVCRIKSSDYPTALLISAPDIGLTTTADVGLYDVAAVNSGAVVDADFFTAALSLKDGAIANSNVLNGNIITLANSEKPIWELLGLSADPGKWYDVALTLVGDADAGGTVKAELKYVDGN